MSFEAQYPGFCKECLGSIRRGDEVTYDHSQIVHAKCPDVDLLAAPSAPLCDRCFCYHNGECL